MSLLFGGGMRSLAALLTLNVWNLVYYRIIVLHCALLENESKFVCVLDKHLSLLRALSKHCVELP